MVLEQEYYMSERLKQAIELMTIEFLDMKKCFRCLVKHLKLVIQNMLPDGEEDW